MSYQYAGKKRAVQERSTPTVSGPSQQALYRGAAPSQAQLGRRVDLPGAIQAKMESAFGADFSGVKLYESQSVADAGASAMAQGNTIAFAPGKLDLASQSGQALLGHELSHVVSQARGEVSGSGFVNDHALEARADREGAMAAAGETVYSGSVAAPLSTASAAPAAGPMQAKKFGKKEPVNPNTPQVSKAGKVNLNRDLGQFWFGAKEDRVTRPDAGSTVSDLTAKYNGPEYVNAFRGGIRNASGTANGGGLAAARLLPTFRGTLGEDVSPEALTGMFDNLMAGHRTDLNRADPAAVAQADRKFDAGALQLKQVYLNQLRKLQSTYGTMGTQMHPEDFIRQVGPDFFDRTAILQDTEQLMVNTPQYFDMEHNEEDKEFARLSNYYNDVFVIMNNYATSGFNPRGGFSPAPGMVEQFVGNSQEHQRAMAAQGGIQGPGMTPKQFAAYKKGLRKRMRGKEDRLFGHFR